MQSTVKDIARWAALGSLFLITLTPLIVVDSFFFPFITGKAFYFRTLVEVAVAAWAVLALMDKAYRPRLSWILAAVLAFVAWMFVADAFAVNALKAFWSNYERMEGWMLLIHLLGFFLAASAVLRVEKQWRNWFLASLGVGVIMVIHAFMQLGGAAAIHQGSTRIDASFGNSAYFAIYLLFNTFLAGWLALTEKNEWLRWALAALAVVSGVLIFYTETRGTALGLIAGLGIAALLAALYSGGKTRKAAVWALGVIVVLIGGFIAIRGTAFVHQNNVLDRLASINVADGQVRFTLWHMAYDGVYASPKTALLGYGQEGFNYVFNKYYDPSLYSQEPWFDRAHNAFIDWFVAGGIPAFLLYISLFVAALWLLWKAPELSWSERVALTAALVGYAIHNSFVFDNLYAYVYFFAILAMIDSQVGRPVRLFEHEKRVGESAGLALGGAVLAFALVFAFVQYRGIATAAELIGAITPSSDAAQNLTVFQDILKHPGFAAQEVREQLVSVMQSVVNSQQASNDTKQRFAQLAITEMQKQITSHPGDTRTVLELALAYRAVGDSQDSLAAVLEAQKLSPGKETLYIQEGATRWDMNDLPGAKAAFDKAYALGPRFTDLATYAAVGDLITGDRAGARAILLQAYGTSTVDSDALALAYYRTKDYPDLISLWQLRNSAPSATATTAFGLAAAYYISGDKADAVREIQAAIIKYPDAAAQGQALIKEINGTSSAQ